MVSPLTMGCSFDVSLLLGGLMSNETYRQFDPWRPSPVKEISRRQIVETHYFNVDHVSYESNQIGSFERYFVQENNGDTSH